jgi:tetratricopeptide (TPR) repeat protein
LTYYDAAGKLGRRLREARLAAGLLQRDLAFPGCTAAYISRIEKGERVPSLQILREFARQLGVSEAYLARGADDEVELSPFVAARAALVVGELDDARRLIDAAFRQADSDHERALASALEGEVALHDGDAAAAIAALERAVALDPELERSDPAVADALGRAYARANDYDNSIAVFLRNYEAATSDDDQLNRVRFGAQLANAYSDSANFGRAESVLGELIVGSADLADPLMRAKLYWSQSRMHALKKDGDSAAHYAELAIEVLELSDQSYYAALAHLLLAHIELDRDNPERALELLEEAEPLVTASGRPYEKANLQLERARALAHLGRGEEAVSLAMATSPVLEQVSPLDAGRGYALMAKVFAISGDNARAVELYELAIERLETVPTRYLVEAYSELAALHENDGHPDRAVELLRRAMDVQRASGRILV